MSEIDYELVYEDAFRQMCQIVYAEQNICVCGYHDAKEQRTTATDEDMKIVRGLMRQETEKVLRDKMLAWGCVECPVNRNILCQVKDCYHCKEYVGWLKED